MREASPSLLITCEHGGNTIPPSYRSVFQDAATALNSHRGYDPGSLELARKLAKTCEAPFEFETRSRLLIELNRTLGHPRIFSKFSKKLSLEDQQHLIETIYLPYRERVIHQIETLKNQGPVLHLSIHSFTPVMNDKTRRTDIGLLFDPSRSFETTVAVQWKTMLQRKRPDLAIHFNLPYRGTSDGFTTALRKQFPDNLYAGIELEVNQRFPLGNQNHWKEIQQGIVASIQTLRSSLF